MIFASTDKYIEAFEQYGLALGQVFTMVDVPGKKTKFHYEQIRQEFIDLIKKTSGNNKILACEVNDNKLIDHSL